MGRNKKGEPLKILISAKIEPELLNEVRASLPEKTSLTAAIEEGLRLWLKSLRRKPGK